MLIDCDTCTVRGQGCDDCVVTVLLGAPPDWQGSDPTVVPLTRRPAVGGAPPLRRTGRPGAVAGPPGSDADAGDRAAGGWGAGSRVAEPGGAGVPGRSAIDRDQPRVDPAAVTGRPVVELDEVERRAVRALAEFGLVPPLRHQDATTPGDRHVS